MSRQWRLGGRSILDLVLWTLLGLLFLNSYGPFTFGMPAAGLDPSWQEGMNQAIAKGLVFGRDLVFTDGPYAYLYTRMFHPAAFWPMSIGSLWLCGICAGCWFWLAHGIKWPRGMTIALLLIVLIPIVDAFFFSLILMVVLCVYRLLALEPECLASTWKARVGIAAMFLTLGLLPLTKGTMLIMTMGAVVFSFALMILHRRWGLALMTLICPPIAMCLLWVVSGAKLANLWEYFTSMRYIVAGYSEAMSSIGSMVDLFIFLVAAFIVLHAVTVVDRASRADRFILLATYVFYLFVTFKAGYVRQDNHIFITLVCVATGGLLLTKLNIAVGERRFIAMAIFLAFYIALPVMWSDFGAAIHDRIGDMQRRRDESRLSFFTRSASGFSGRDWRLIAQRSVSSFDFEAWRFGPAALQHAYDDAHQETRRSEGLKFAIQGDADVYTVELAALFANGWSWNPRPVLQSYSAYTPELCAMNEAHLRTPSAPGNILYQLSPIDERFPALEDGMSLPAMLDNYQVKEQSAQWIHLTRKDGPIHGSSSFRLLEQRPLHLGEDIEVPSVDGPLYAKIDISPSILGKAGLMLYKIPALSLRVTKANGDVKSYRVVSGMMKTGFFLSPVVTDNQEFAQLFDSQAVWRNDQKVKSFALDVDGMHRRFWSDSYVVSFLEYLR